MRYLCTLFAAALAAGPGFAQAKPAPAVEIRVKSVNDLLDRVEYLGGLVGKDEEVKQGTGFVRAMAGEKGIGGVDPKKPIGGYMVATANLVDSPPVLMLPIKSEEGFLELLRGPLNMDPKKGDDGAYELQIPNFDPAVYFRFAKGYLFATIKDKKPIAEDALIDPKTFFAVGETATLAVAVNVDRIPADIRKTIVGQMDHQFAQEKEKKDAGATPPEQALKAFLLDGLASAVASFLTDGKAMTVRVEIEPKTDDLSLSVSATAAAGSDMAKALKAVGGRKAVAPAAAVAKNLVFGVAVNAGLPESMLPKFAALIDLAVEQALKGAAPNDLEAAKKALAAVVPTAKAGNFELGVAMTGPADDSTFRLTAAARVKDGGGIAKTVSEFAPFPPLNALKPKLAVEKAGAGLLHQFADPSGEFVKLFASDAVWLVTGDELLTLGTGPDATGAKAAAAAGPVATGELFRAELSAVAAAYAFEKDLKPSTLKTLVNDIFDRKSPDGLDRVSVVVAGGDKLTVKATAKGRAFKLIAAIGEMKKAK